MSRHRHFQNYDYDQDFEDPYSSAASSVDESSLSSSMEEYMYNRHGNPAARIHDYFDDKQDDQDQNNAQGRRSPTDSESSGDLNYENLCTEDYVRLNDCYEKVVDVVGENADEKFIKDSIIRCNFNAEVAINTVLNNPMSLTGKRNNSLVYEEYNDEPKLHSTQSPISIPGRGVQENRRPVVIKIGSSPSPTPSRSLSPAPTKQETSAAVAQPNPVVAEAKALPIKEKEPQLPTIVKTSVIDKKLDPNSSILSNLNTTLDATDSILKTPSKIVTMRKVQIDGSEAYKSERHMEKELINLVVVGHVDSGKSTLMGHLLFDLGSVSPKLMHKYKRESQKIGKQSFAYAWVLDETSEERERGITMDVGHNTFQTKNRTVTLLDAPGHKDFIPNMINGAYQADVAILVINASKGEFETGFDNGGQTREHALLVRSLGVTQLAVAINKMDTVDYDEIRYKEIVSKISVFLKQAGFKQSSITYVPCSGFTGENLIKKSDKISWYKGKTLLEIVDSFQPPERMVNKSFRLSISDIYSKPQSSGFCVSGRIEAGFVQKGDKVMICPINEVVTVKSVNTGDDLTPLTKGFAGDPVSLSIVGIEMNNVIRGMVVCDPAKPIHVTKKFRARIVIFNIDIPITKGFPVVLHYSCVQVQASFKKLISTIDKTNGEVSKKKPRCLSSNCNAIVDLVTESPICLETYANVKELGRFMLRSNGKTIAAGLVTEIF